MFNLQVECPRTGIGVSGKCVKVKVDLDSGMDSFLNARQFNTYILY